VEIGEVVGGDATVCGPDTTVAAAAGIMINEQIGSLGVFDGGRLVGIFTERDVLRAVADGRNLDRSSVGEFMTPEPDSLAPDVDAFDAAEWLLATGYRHLPIMEDGHLLGIASIKDVLWAVTETHQTLLGREEE
jgi:CBS domain-containing protein